MDRLLVTAVWIAVLAVVSINLRGESPTRTDGNPAIHESYRGRDPRASWDRSGTLHVTFVRDVDGQPQIFYARAGAHPSAPVPMPFAPKGVDATSEAAASIEVLPDGALVVVYSIKTPREAKGHEWDAEIRAQVSRDGGNVWSAPVLVHDDGKACSHDLVSTAVASSGELLVAWLDSRTGIQGLEVARSRDGVHFTRNVRLDDRTCECCGISILPEPGGGALLAYRDLQETDLRDISLLRIDGSDRVKAAAPLSRDGWHVNGCPDQGPRLARAADGRIWAAWFTGVAPGVYVGSSSNGGKTFSRTGISPASGNAPANHPEMVALPNGRLAVLFDATAGDGRGIFARTADAAGRSWSNPHLVAPHATAARAVLSGSRAALTYTAQSGNDTFAVVTTAPFRGRGALGSPAEEGK